MSVSDILIKSYQLTNKTGLLSLPLAKRLFRASYFLYKRYLEDPFAALIKEHSGLFTDGHVLDVGANIGYTASVFARAVSNEYSVYAFEPDPENFAQLAALSQSCCHSGRIKPVHAAVGAHEGTLQIWYNQAHHADHRVVTAKFKDALQGSGTQHSVAQWSIDGFVSQKLAGEKIAFVKIDVQGYELPVLQGMQAVLRDNPGLVLAIEIAPQHIDELGFDSDQILDLIESAGFQLYRLELRKPLKQLSRTEVNQIAETRGYVDLLCSRHPLT